jgi:hypothetical protein
MCKASVIFLTVKLCPPFRRTEYVIRVSEKRVMRRVSVHTRETVKKKKKAGENCVMKGFMICTFEVTMKGKFVSAPAVKDYERQVV